MTIPVTRPTAVAPPTSPRAIAATSSLRAAVSDAADSDVSDSAGTNACAECGHENLTVGARWCAVCGTNLPASPDGAMRGVGPRNQRPPDTPSMKDTEVSATTDGRWLASGSLRLAVPVLFAAVLIILVSPTGVDRFSEFAAETDEEVELPTADTTASNSDAQDANRPSEDGGTAGDVVPGAAVGADRVSSEPPSPTRDLESSGGLIITTERSTEHAIGKGAADVFAVHAMTGEQMWKRTVSAPCSPATAPEVAVAGRWVIVALCAQLTGLDLADGEVVWQHRTDWQIRLSDVVAAPREDPEVILVITSTRTAWPLDRIVTAIDAETGKIRWERDVVRAAATPDAAVVLDEHGRVSGLAPATGEPMWETTPDDPPTELHAVAGTILESDDQDGTRGRLRAAADGQLLFDDEVHRQGLAMSRHNALERRIEVVTTTAEIALIDDGRVSWATPQLRAGCCVSSFVPPEGPVAVLLADGTLLRLNRDDGQALSDRGVRDIQEPNTTLAGRPVLAADEPIGHRAGSLRLVDTSDPTGWRVVATLAHSQVSAVLPEGTLLLTDAQLQRLINPWDRHRVRT